MNETLLSLQQVADRLGKSREWVYRQCLNGRMAHRRFGNARMLTEGDLAEFINRAKKDPWVRSAQSRARRRTA